MRTCFAFCCLLLLGACSVETIVAANVERAPDSGSDLSCTSQADCQVNEYCSRLQCGDARGLCQLRPVGCALRDEPVCGCDGITYLNDCLREGAGMSLAGPGPCTSSALRCGGPPGDRCPPGSYCGLFVPSGAGCMRGARGTCWVVPAACDTAPHPGDRFIACAPGPPACVDVCTAVKTQEPYARVSACPAPK